MAYDTSQKRPLYGARVLQDPNDTFQHNAWDNVKWDIEQEKEAQKRVEQQAEQKISEMAKSQFLRETEFKWDQFYDVHQNRFFKDRHWLFTEFPELAGEEQKSNTPIRIFSGANPTEGSCNMDNTKSNGDENEIKVNIDSKEFTNTTGESCNMANIKNNGDEGQTKRNIESSQSKNTSSSSKSCGKERKNYLEIGCGVGNTVFPILEYNIDPNLFVYCCDFSKNAVDILKSRDDYNSKRCEAFVCDVTADEWNTPFPSANIDVTTLIFVLSAIHPHRMKHVVKQVYHYLKPGGLVLFRDYGRYDMAQLRFKTGQMMEDNFYVRKDGTFVYFFTQEEVHNLFCEAGFQEELNYVDRRLQVNRSRQIKMYRVWVQAKYRKPFL